jgi:hypothetical protein
LPGALSTAGAAQTRGSRQRHLVLTAPVPDWDAKIRTLVESYDYRLDGLYAKDWLQSDAVSAGMKATFLDVLSRLRTFPSPDYPLIESVFAVLGVSDAPPAVYLLIGGQGPDDFGPAVEDLALRTDDRRLKLAADVRAGRDYPTQFVQAAIAHSELPDARVLVNRYTEIQDGPSALIIHVVTVFNRASSGARSYAAVQFRSNSLERRHEHLRKAPDTAPFVYYSLQ